jgi:hypothetical protein
MKTALYLLALCCAVTAHAEEAKPQSPGSGVKAMSGMSVLGNNEAPKSLVIVPWKSSELGDGIDMGYLLDDRATPVDREVFMRELSYYEIRVGGSTSEQN